MDHKLTEEDMKIIAHYIAQKNGYKTGVGIQSYLDSYNKTMSELEKYNKTITKK